MKVEREVLFGYNFVKCMFGATGSCVEWVWPERVGWCTKIAELRVRERDGGGGQLSLGS